MKTCQFLLGLLPLALAFGVGCSADAGDITPLGLAGGTNPGGVAGATSGAGGSAAGATATSVAGNASGGGFNGSSGAGGAGGTGGSVIGQAGTSTQAGAGGSGGPVPTDGKGLYDANCKLCHGEQGIGSPLAYAIQHPVRDYSNWVVRNGRALAAPFPKAMEKWGTDKLSDAQLTLIWDYLDQPPQPKTGQLLYNDYCANCHGTDAKGGPTTRNIINEVQNVLKLVRSGKNVGQYQMRHDSMPVFNTTRISDAELNLIHDYVDSF